MSFRPEPRLIALTTVALVGVALLSALGAWQLERRVWKSQLIERVETRIHVEPAAPPSPAVWDRVTAARDEYRRVHVSGYFLNDSETLVRASTRLGSGFWVLTPLRTDLGFTVLVNRGFVPLELREPDKRGGQIGGKTSVTGLLRMTELKGGFLRPNDPAHDRWYVRDVSAIAAARGLTGVAPYFIDADASAAPDDWPRGGLTVLAFPNSHLVYAVTWFGLAFALSAAVVFVWREERHAWRSF